MAKRDLRAALNKSQANIASTLGAPDRFASAAKTLESQPTGFHDAAAPIENVLVSSSPKSPDGPYEVEVPPSEVQVNPYNARRIYRQDRVLARAQSIAALGQQNACLATVRNGQYVLADGEYRLRACKHLKKPTIRLRVLPGLTDAELYKHSYDANEEREAQSPLDDAFAWKQLLDDGIYPSEAALEPVVNKSAPTINKTIQLLKLPGSITELIKQSSDPSKFSLSALYELVLYMNAAGPEGEKDALALAERLGREEIGRKEITEARQKISEPKQRKTKETPRQYKIPMKDGEGTGSAGFIKEFNSGKVAFEITILDAKEREKLMDELRERFKAQ